MNNEKQFNLNDKRILLTGATGTLGRTFTEALINEGANLVLLDHQDTDILQFSSLHDVKGIELDLTDEANVIEAIDNAYSILGGFDGVINNAAATSEFLLKTGEAFANFEDYPSKVWKHTLDVNLTGVFLICREAGKHMLSSGGSIINMSSIYGVRGPDHRIYEDQLFKSMPGYSASKAGVIGLTQWLATWWSKNNIRVNCVSPGGIFNDHDKGFVENYANRTPMARMADREEIVGILLFLLSDLSSYCTGQNYIVDGGYTAW